MKKFFSVPVLSPHGNYEIEIPVGRDVKLIESQRNVVSMPGPIKYRHLPAPEEEIERGKRILEILYPKPGMLPLTVGGLSVVAAERRKNKKHSEDNSCDASLNLEWVYVGPRPSDFQPSTSQSQKIDRGRLLKHENLMRKLFLIKNPSVPNAKMEQMVLQK